MHCFTHIHHLHTSVVRSAKSAYCMEFRLADSKKLYPVSGFYIWLYTGYYIPNCLLQHKKWLPLQIDKKDKSLSCLFVLNLDLSRFDFPILNPHILSSGDKYEVFDLQPPELKWQYKVGVGGVGEYNMSAACWPTWIAPCSISIFIISYIVKSNILLYKYNFNWGNWLLTVKFLLMVNHIAGVN